MFQSVCFVYGINCEGSDVSERLFCVWYKICCGVSCQNVRLVFGKR